MHELVDQTVLKACVDQLSRIDVDDVLTRVQAFHQEQLSSLKIQIGGLTAELARIETALQRNRAAHEGCRPSETQYYRGRISELLSQRDEQAKLVSDLGHQLRQRASDSVTREQVIGALNNWPQRFAEASKERQRAMLSDVVSRVVYRPEQRCVDIVFKFDPGIESQAFCMQDAPKGDPAVAFCMTRDLVQMQRHWAPDAKERCREQVRTLKQQGTYIPGSLPLGFVKTGGRIDVDPVGGDVIRGVYDLALAGHSLAAIAQHVNTTFKASVRGTTWTAHRVLMVLTNPVYCGYYRLDGGPEVPGLSGCVPSQVVPALIAPKAWIAVQDRLGQVG